MVPEMTSMTASQRSAPTPTAEGEAPVFDQGRGKIDQLPYPEPIKLRTGRRTRMHRQRRRPKKLLRLKLPFWSLSNLLLRNLSLRFLWQAWAEPPEDSNSSSIEKVGVWTQASKEPIP